MLTEKQIDAEAFARWGDMKGTPLAMCRGFARAIEAEVRKQDTELIRQMTKALSVAVKQNDHDMVMTGEELRQAYLILASAHARLGEKT